jgi:hypothetical protein
MLMNLFPPKGRHFPVKATPKLSPNTDVNQRDCRHYSQNTRMNMDGNQLGDQVPTRAGRLGVLLSQWSSHLQRNGCQSLGAAGPIGPGRPWPRRTGGPAADAGSGARSHPPSVSNHEHLLGVVRAGVHGAGLHVFASMLNAENHATSPPTDTHRHMQQHHVPASMPTALVSHACMMATRVGDGSGSSTVTCTDVAGGPSTPPPPAVEPLPRVTVHSPACPRGRHGETSSSHTMHGHVGRSTCHPSTPAKG